LQSFEEHVTAVEMVLIQGEAEGRVATQMLVSRDVRKLSREQILSVAYESGGLCRRADFLICCI
jgi:cobalamin biosynthesis protein CobD/CbiB